MMPKPPIAPTARLLLVDDEPLNLHALYRILKDEYELLMAKSGEEALRVCQQSQPALVLLDIVMPDMDGCATCEAIHALPGMQATPVVFVSGHDSNEEKARAKAAGGAGYITKPVDPIEVRDCVRAQLRQV